MVSLSIAVLSKHPHKGHPLVKLYGRVYFILRAITVVACVGTILLLDFAFMFMSGVFGAYHNPSLSSGFKIT